jgi:hypothetical protein
MGIQIDFFIGGPPGFGLFGEGSLPCRLYFVERGICVRSRCSARRTTGIAKGLRASIDLHAHHGALPRREEKGDDVVRVQIVANFSDTLPRPDEVF